MIFSFFCNSSSVADLKLAISAPSGAVGRWSVKDVSSAALDGSTSLTVAMFGVDAPLIVTVTVVNGSTAGTIKLKFAQNTAQVSDTVMLKYSSLRAWAKV